MSRLAGILVIGISLMMPVSFVSAQDHDQGDHMTPMAHHQWSDHEEEHWQSYEKAHHRKDHDWTTASKREQTGYWKWRDKHPDPH